MVTDRQVETQAEKNESLRQKIAELNADREANELAMANETKMRRLKNDEATLKQELEYQTKLAKARAKAKSDPGLEPQSSPAAVGTNITTPVEVVVGDEKKEK